MLGHWLLLQLAHHLSLEALVDLGQLLAEAFLYLPDSLLEAQHSTLDPGLVAQPHLREESLVLLLPLSQLLPVQLQPHQKQLGLVARLVDSFGGFHDFALVDFALLSSELGRRRVAAAVHSVAPRAAAGETGMAFARRAALGVRRAAVPTVAVAAPALISSLRAGERKAQTAAQGGTDLRRYEADPGQLGQVTLLQVLEAAQTGRRDGLISANASPRRGHHCPAGEGHKQQPDPHSESSRCKWGFRCSMEQSLPPILLWSSRFSAETGLPSSDWAWLENREITEIGRAHV